MPFTKPRKVAVLLAVLAIVAVFGGVGAAIYAGWGPFDLRSSSRNLDSDILRYRAAGLPWLASEMAPPVADKDNAAPLMLKAMKALKDNGFTDKFSATANLRIRAIFQVLRGS